MNCVVLTPLLDNKLREGMGAGGKAENAGRGCRTMYGRCAIADSSMKPKDRHP